MAQRIGIRQNTIQVFVSGARVAFDPRTTAHVVNTIDNRNFKADEQPYRKMLWEERQRNKRKLAPAAAE